MEKVVMMQDWLEFKCCDYYEETDNNCYFVNLRRTEISEVRCLESRDPKNRTKCVIHMKNGNTYSVLCPYEKVMEMV